MVKNLLLINVLYHSVLDFDAFLSDEKAENYLKYAEPTINKAELKKALKQGETFKGVHLSTNSNIQIK